MLVEEVATAGAADAATDIMYRILLEHGSTFAVFATSPQTRDGGCYNDDYYNRYEARLGDWRRVPGGVRLDDHEVLRVSRRSDWGWRLASGHVVKDSCDVSLYRRAVWLEHSHWLADRPRWAWPRGCGAFLNGADYSGLAQYPWESNGNRSWQTSEADSEDDAE